MAKRRARRQPQRTCIACRRVMPKRELTRIVRRPDGEVVIDLTGKVSGRGAYLCSASKCWADALEHKSLERALETALTTQQHQAIEAYASGLPEANSEAQGPSRSS